MADPQTVELLARIRKITTVNGVVTNTYYPSPYYHAASDGSAIRYYFLGAMWIAERHGSGSTPVIYRHGDQVDSTIYTHYNSHKTGRHYTAYGDNRGGLVDTYYTYAGQYEDGTGLVYMNARYYDPNVGLFISPDSIIPDPSNVLDYNRYLYARGNPVSNNDPSGHCIGGLDTAVCIAIAMGASKAIDWGWTGYDLYQYGTVLFDPNASPEAIAQAKTDMYTAIMAEALEPDEATFGIPLDDIVRHWDDIAPILAVAISRGAGEEVAEQSFKAFTASHFRANLKTLTGRTADQIAGLQAHHVLPQKFSRNFADAGLNVHDPKFGTWVDATHQQWSYEYNERWRTFLETQPTRDEILIYAENLSQEFGFGINFTTP